MVPDKAQHKDHSSYSNVHLKYRKRIKLYIQPAYCAYATNNRYHWSNYYCLIAFQFKKNYLH